ncbi:MAG: oxidoreductase [Candidatus Methanomethylophilaceae archaeon]|jgi:F420-non-reducing hydrogenase small subunit|nr:oxidoreductase [Candidatus Methanomethylophilaceae archaeon]NLF34115.1 oxidoreductase [Thermoplasmatales archaeon]
MGFFDIFKKNKAEKTDKTAKPAKKEAEEKKATPRDAAAPATSGLPAVDLGELLPGAPKNGKIKLAIYWAAACGGCDVSLLDTNERILTIGDMADIVMWPIAADGKEKDIAAMGDQEITVSIINGAVRNSENEHMVKLLRQKSLLVISYGSCACFGGTPALANLVDGKDDILDYVYTKTPTTANFQEQCGHKSAPIIPQNSYQAPEGELTLPLLYDTVKSLDQVIDVDYSIPGCPPQQESIAVLLKALVDFVYNGVALPPKGTMIGVTTKTLCEECPRHKENRRITKICEPHEVDVDPELCLMDQGILCLGPATVGGCGAKCTRVGQPCRGCYGPTEVVQEQGASMFTAVASLFPVLEEDPTCSEDEIIDIMSTVKDPLGYFYAFSMSKALIKRKVSEKGGQ